MAGDDMHQRGSAGNSDEVHGNVYSSPRTVNDAAAVVSNSGLLYDVAHIVRPPLPYGDGRDTRNDLHDSHQLRLRLYHDLHLDPDLLDCDHAIGNCHLYHRLVRRGRKVRPHAGRMPVHSHEDV